ncbi:hypothetical protein [Vibrio alginolyticus]|uniref:oxidoreductase n=2 Tax=Vibrio harveyi group TaxID=717610 RepID=UPI0006A7CA9E|nr:hypothetical protein [Vibrio alginolyticus]
MACDNKVFFLPVNTGYGKSGNPDNRLIDFHRERSGNGIYCSIIGNVVTPKGFGSNDYCLTITKHKNWKIIAEEILGNGSVPGIQLSTAWKDYKGNQKFVSSSSDDFSQYTEKFLKVSCSEIDEVFDDFYKGVNLALNAGYKHIQIHAAHGYLLSLLVDSVFCENSHYTLTKLSELLDYIRSQNSESSVRFSLKVGIQSIDKIRQEGISRILQLNSDYFDISFGFYNINKHLIYPTSVSMLKSRYDNSIALANQYPDKEFIFSGKSLVNFEGEFPSNVSLGICRDLIANPKYLINNTVGCENNKQCHYFSRGERSLSCKKWLEKN